MTASVSGRFLVYCGSQNDPEGIGGFGGKGPACTPGLLSQFPPARDILNCSNDFGVFARDILIADGAPRRTSRTKTPKNKISWVLDLGFHARRPHRRKETDEDVSNENALGGAPTRDVLIGAGREIRMSRTRALLEHDVRGDVSREIVKIIEIRIRQPFPPRKPAYALSFAMLLLFLAQK